ncbi:MAG: DUF4251 domain-containing protein [Proteiniphilum sp.]|nr:DUF4251 domain-containing protein [Proteiniphilum sp.]
MGFICSGLICTIRRWIIRHLNEGGFQFTSTDFIYRYGSGSRRGNWIALITIHDLDRSVTFSFDIWENGSSSLVVNDVNRQSISFRGNVRSREEADR